MIENHSNEFEKNGKKRIFQKICKKLSFFSERMIFLQTLKNDGFLLNERFFEQIFEKKTTVFLLNEQFF